MNNNKKLNKGKEKEIIHERKKKHFQWKLRDKYSLERNKWHK